MIKNILEILPYIQKGTELIEIAKGKYKYPETYTEAFKIIKKEIWHKN